MTFDPVFTWRFSEEGDLGTWTAWNIDQQFEVIDQELVLQSSGSDPYLFRDVAFDAATVDVIRVSVASASEESTERAQLFWSRAGEEFSVDRVVSTVAPSGTSTYSFDLSRDARWQGEIGRIRLDPTNLPGRRIRIQQIEGLRKRLNNDALNKGLEHAWKMDLANDVRTVMLAPPDRPVAHVVSVGNQNELRFAIGLWTEVVGPLAEDVDVTVRASFTPTPTGDGPRVLFEWKPGREVHDRLNQWREVAVDISSLAGQHGELRLETHAGRRPDLLRALPVVTPPRLVASRTQGRPNVVVVSIDTLRADHLSFYGYDVQTSPNIDAWARRSGVTFETAVAQAPWTLPSHVSMFTGLDAIRHGVNYDRPMPTELPTLAERLQAAGYETLAVTGGVYLHPRYGLSQGFNAYAYWDAAQTSREDELVRGMERSLTFIERNADRAFFLFLHTYDVHAPSGGRRDGPHDSADEAAFRAIALDTLPIDARRTTSRSNTAHVG